jgi:hypothetical protein
VDPVGRAEPPRGRGDRGLDGALTEAEPPGDAADAAAVPQELESFGLVQAEAGHIAAEPMVAGQVHQSPGQQRPDDRGQQPGGERALVDAGVGAELDRLFHLPAAGAQLTEPAPAVARP